MKGFASLISLLIAAGTLFFPTPEIYRFSSEEPVLVKFHDTIWDMPEACEVKLEEGDKLYGCYHKKTKTIHLPNPCYYPEAENSGSFAYLACHEKAHANGWRH